MASLMRVILCMLAALITIAGWQTACAQRWEQLRRQQKRFEAMQKLKLPPLSADGTIEAVARGALKIKTNSGDLLLVQILPNATIEVTGSAEVDFLARGHFIIFTAAVDKRRSRVQDKVAKLIIFTPTETNPLGAFYDQGDRGFGDAGGEFGQAEAGQGDAAAHGRFAQGSGKGTSANVEVFEVRGQIRDIKKGRIEVYCPTEYFKKPLLRMELAESPEIKVELADYSVAGPGDKVQVKGFQIANNVGRASHVSIELAKPLVGPRKKRAIPRQPSSRRSKQGDAKQGGSG